MSTDYVKAALEKYAKKRDLVVLDYYTTPGGEGPYGESRGPHYRALLGDTSGNRRLRVYFNPNPKQLGGPARGWQRARKETN